MIGNGGLEEQVNLELGSLLGPFQTLLGANIEHIATIECR
jgi:hypothetical protein